MQTLGQFLDAPMPEYDWVIPGFLERQDRLIITGERGQGKSTLLRQIAVQSTSGIHPFTLESIEPLYVLCLDLENHQAQNRREFNKLLEGHDPEPPREHIYFESLPGGIDLSTKKDQVWLTGLIANGHPDLVLIGPMYKMSTDDPHSLQAMSQVARFFDALISEHGFALILESHPPHDTPDKVVMRPFGTAMWTYWPEFGFHLSASGKITHWRGMRDDSRQIPTGIVRGSEWPWMPAHSDDLLFHQAINYGIEIGRKPSLRELERALPKASKSALGRILLARKEQWDRLEWSAVPRLSQPPSGQ